MRVDTKELAGLTVLVVEDSEEAGALLCDILTSWGAFCRRAADGAAALRAVAAECPDAVLLDIGLPEIDGWEVARRLRATPAGATLPIAALTAYDTSEDVHRSRDAGLDAHFVKPVLPDVLHRWLISLRTAPSASEGERPSVAG
jgi:CheY-like chemotaxis protein